MASISIKTARKIENKEVSIGAAIALALVQDVLSFQKNKVNIEASKLQAANVELAKIGKTLVDGKVVPLAKG